MAEGCAGEVADLAELIGSMNSCRCARQLADRSAPGGPGGRLRAGQRAAVLQTLLGTARLNGVEPMAWLKDVLEKLPTWPNSRLDELLPLRPPAS